MDYSLLGTVPSLRSLSSVSLSLPSPLYPALPSAPPPFSPSPPSLSLFFFCSVGVSKRLIDGTHASPSAGVSSEAAEDESDKSQHQHQDQGENEEFGNTRIQATLLLSPLSLPSSHRRCCVSIGIRVFGGLQLLHGDHRLPATLHSPQEAGELAQSSSPETAQERALLRRPHQIQR
jgi:hypothetical protein